MHIPQWSYEHWREGDGGHHDEGAQLRPPPGRFRWSEVALVKRRVRILLQSPYTPWDCRICRSVGVVLGVNVGIYGIHGVSGIHILAGETMARSGTPPLDGPVSTSLRSAGDF